MTYVYEVEIEEFRNLGISDFRFTQLGGLIGQFAKEKPADMMKEAADAFTGSHLSEPHTSEGCPATALKQESAGYQNG